MDIDRLLSKENINRKVVLDTSVLMEDLDKVNELLECNIAVVIPFVVLQELDHHKERYNDPRRSYLARESARFIEDNVEDLVFTGEEKSDNITNDDLIISIAQKNDYIIWTNDLLMSIKSRALNIDVLDMSDGIDKDSKGYHNIYMSDEEMAEFYQTKANRWDIQMNEFIKVHNKNGEFVDLYKWDGRSFVRPRYQTVKSKHMGDIEPINTEQKMLFDVLQDRDIKVILATGKFGTGKDICMLSHALDKIDRGHYGKLVWCRNNITVRNTRDIGALPGGLEDKIMPFAKTIADHVGGIDGLHMMMDSGIIELEHMGFARGRDFQNSIVYITECENMTTDLLKLMMTRVGEGSILYLNGDLEQTDGMAFKNDNAITGLVNNLRGHPQFAHIQLQECERSDVARMSELIK